MSTPARAAADMIGALDRLGPAETAVVLGRDFFAVADIAEQATSIPYADLPGFPPVAGGELTLGLVEGSPMLFFRGRSEFYASGDPSLMSGAFETLSHLGVRAVLSTGTVNSTNADILPPSLLSVSDHINFTGLNPLIGAAGDNFVNMNAAYDKRLMRRLKQSSAAAGVSLSEGVMMWCSGPSFETPAETKVARQLGADALGMSIAPEAILARRFALPFAGVAVVTDYAAGFCNGNPSHDPTRSAGLVALRRLLRAFQKNK
ncbi:phosphorylase [Methylosinus sp. Sm6]|uniref:phosphorylase family protein n=1 Tax=Methylosinus sp. Sm6 TaxID=2866948 RepID=UPI001C990CCE|nr:phosphorylase [Methylosinus sp. Sm6]MBY6243597.1 phosphorylase [Methylosinus sp. Sm6]